MGTMVSQGRMWYELDACPFCGGKANLKDVGNNRLHIYCSDCPARLGSTWGSDESLEYLAAAWNRRAKGQG